MKSLLLFAPALYALIVFPAAAQKLPEPREFLPYVCDMVDISGQSCKNARNYPDHEGKFQSGCSLDVGIRPARAGRFLSSSGTLVMVSYSSDCEPRFSQFGGSLLFERQPQGYVFRNYIRGVDINDCVILRNPYPALDMLVCSGAFLSQGFLEQSIIRLIFNLEPDGNIGVSSDLLLRGDSAQGAYGVNVVECNKSHHFFGFGALEPVGANAVALRVSYATDKMIRVACRRPRAALPKDSRDAKLPPNSAAISAEVSERFVLNLVTRKLQRP